MFDEFVVALALLWFGSSRCLSMLVDICLIDLLWLSNCLLLIMSNHDITLNMPLMNFRLFHHVCCCFVPNLILFFFVRILDVVCFTTWLSYSMLLLNCLIWLDLIWSHLSAFVSIMSLILLTLNWSVLLTVVIRCSRCSVHSKEFGSVWFDSLSPAWSQGLIWSIAVQCCCLIFSALGCNSACVLERPDTLPWTLPWSIR